MLRGQVGVELGAVRGEEADDGQGAAVNCSHRIVLAECTDCYGCDHSCPGMVGTCDDIASLMPLLQER